MSYGVGRRHDLDLTLLWLWCRPAATAPIGPLAGKPPCAMVEALKKKKKKKKKKVGKYLLKNIWMIGCTFPPIPPTHTIWRQAVAGEIGKMRPYEWRLYIQYFVFGCWEQGRRKGLKWLWRVKCEWLAWENVNIDNIQRRVGCGGWSLFGTVGVQLTLPSWRWSLQVCGPSCPHLALGGPVSWASVLSHFLAEFNWGQGEETRVIWLHLHGLTTSFNGHK